MSVQPGLHLACSPKPPTLNADRTEYQVFSAELGTPQQCRDNEIMFSCSKFVFIVLWLYSIYTPVSHVFQFVTLCRKSKKWRAHCPALILRDESCTGVAEYFFDNFVAYILYYGAIFAVFDKVAAQPAFESWTSLYVLSFLFIIWRHKLYLASSRF